MNDQVPHDRLNYDQITDQIFVGTNFCCQTHFDKELLDKGVYADISIEGERIDAAQGVEYYLWLPTVDNEAPMPDQLKQGSDAIKNLVDAGKKIYVHCKNGHGRAPTMVAAYLILTGMSADEAIETLHTKRRGSHINDKQRAALIKFSE